MAQGDSVSQRAQRLDAEGQSREAVRVLEEATTANASHPGRNLLAYYLLRDGREARYLELYARSESSWMSDPYLVFQHAQALYRLDRLGKARSEYERLLSMSGVDAQLIGQAKRNLAGLDREQSLLELQTASQGRARLLAGFGFALILGTAACLCFFERRSRVQAEEASR